MSLLRRLVEVLFRPWRVIATLEGRRVELRRLSLVLASGALVSGLEVIGVGLVFPLIALGTDPSRLQTSRYLGAVHAWLGQPALGLFVALLAGAICVVFVAKAIFTLWFTHYLHRMTAAARMLVGTRLYAAYLHAPLSIHNARNTGEMIHRAANVTFGSYGTYVQANINILIDLAIVIAIMALLIGLQPVPTLVVGGGLLGFGLLQHGLLHSLFGRLGAEANTLGGAHLKFLGESFRAIREIKVFAREAYFVALADRLHAQMMRNNVKLLTAMRAQPLFAEVALLLSVSGAMAAIFLSGNSVAEGMAAIGLLAAGAFRLLPMFNRIQNNINMLNNARPAIDELIGEFAALEHARRVGTDQAVPFERSIELSGIEVVYPGRNTPALADIQLTIARGECIGIVGASGAGKTTLVNLLLGLVEPTGGSLLADGAPIDPTGAGWRSHLAFVPQSIYILDDSIARNVAFGLPDAQIDRDRVSQALAAAGLADVVAQLEHGLDTRIGEDAALFSGGQRQRIGIARALYLRRDVLVLDEATSALDPVSEQSIVRTLAQLKGKITMIIISHREATLAGCDRIVRLRDGRLSAPVEAHASVAPASSAD